jgi:hypothetical protein
MHDYYNYPKPNQIDDSLADPSWRRMDGNNGSIHSDDKEILVFDRLCEVG